MSVATPPLMRFEDTSVTALEGLSVPWQAAPAPAPRLLTLNAELAAELGADPAALRTPEGVAFLLGAGPSPVAPVALAYAGHQFGGFSPRLGDGRALLLGEVLDVHGRRRDLHLKGSGRTPFARGGDGKAAVGPMLREDLVSEAMHALGIPTTRALAVVATGEPVRRDVVLPGAVLARVAASHLRVGTFEYAAAHGSPELVRQLADYAIARHYPGAAAAAERHLAFFEAVVEAQAALIARWMLVGFVHGVMNTDNMAISGETIDYGPCAFLDAFDPSTVFSSIDHAGRYAFANQPRAAQWNLARLAETLVPLLDPRPEAAVAAATAVLDGFPARYSHHWERGLRAKLGLPDAQSADPGLPGDLVTLMQAGAVDWTRLFRDLSAVLQGDTASARVLFADPAGFDAWTARWLAELEARGAEPAATAAAMDRVNPLYLPRNHLVEDALIAATVGDLEPYERLREVLAQPFDERPGLEAFAAAPPAGAEDYRTFCGT